MASLMIILFASLLTITGLALVYASWQRTFTRRALPLWGGWLLLLTALVPWVLATGPGVGVTLGLLMPSLYAWLFVAGNREVRMRTSAPASPGNGGGDARLGLSLCNLPPWQRNATLLLLSVPLAALSATFTSVAVAGLLPWSQVNRMVLGIFLMPVVWGALAVWQCADPRWQRPALAMLAATAVSAALLFL